MLTLCIKHGLTTINVYMPQLLHAILHIPYDEVCEIEYNSEKRYNISYLNRHSAPRSIPKMKRMVLAKSDQKFIPRGKEVRTSFILL